MKPGGTEGGVLKFFSGAILAILSLWVFFSQVHVVSGRFGQVSHAIGRMAGQSAGGIIVFIPLVIGLVLLFFNAKAAHGWVLTGVGVVVLVIEMLSRLQFAFAMPTSMFLVLVVTFCAGIGLMLKGYMEDRAAQAAQEQRRNRK